MYIVKLINGDITTSIHGHKDKLKSGNIVKGINSIDSFSFTLLKSNPGFNKVFDFSTLVTVYNTNKKRYDFLGRVLYSSTSMDENGMITKEVTCESYFGFLCDSQQPYVEATNWTVKGLLQHIIDRHNEQVEDYKKFTIGTVTVTDPNDNVYIGIQRENTWDTIRTKLIEKLGGEIRFRAEGDVLYLDYLTEIGETRLTEIALSRNMKAITKENNPSDYVTRLIPLGSKIKITGEDGEETESEQRVDITSVNDGKNYIDNADGIELYGIHVGYVFFDDVTVPNNLLQKGREYLIANSKVQVKYSVSALDLSLLGLDIDDFDVHNRHPIKNPLIGIDDTARIIKKNVDVCEEIKSTIEIGDSFKTLSEIQREQIQNLKDTIDKIKYDTSDIKGKISVTQKDVNKLNTKIEGIDGTYLYIMYSPYEDGHEMTNTPDENTMYMGTCSTSEEEAPTDYTLYNWVKVRGLEGKSLQVKYLNSATTPVIANNDVSGWSDTVPTPEKGKRTYMVQKLSGETNWSTPIQISGEDGATPTFSISENGYWIINGEETDTKAQGETPEITVGANGNWFVDGVDTNTKAQGEQGKDGADIEYVYYRSQNATSLSAPTYSSGKLPNGWTASPQGITETYKYEYASVRKKTAGSSSWGAFSTPFIWSKWGEKGTDGDGVEYKYYLLNSATKPTYSASDTKWTDEPTGVSEKNMYEYVVQITHHGDGTTTNSAVALWSKWGEQGIQGDPGEGISTVTNYYLASASASGVTTSTTGWNTDVSTQTLTATKKYLWNYEKITYTGSKTPTTTTPCIIGVFGKDGKGISSITEYYLASSSASGVTTSTTGWDTKPQTTDTSKKYLWNYEKIIYTDGSEGTTDPIIIGVHGATGASATAYSMITSSSVIAKSASGSLSPSSITLSGKSKTGTSSPVDYACRFKIETTTDMSNWTAPYTSTSNVSSYTYTVPSGIKALRCSMYLAGGTSTLLDQQVIPVVSDGTNGNDAYTVILSNESHTFVGDTEKALSDQNIKVTAIAYKGATRVTSSIGTISNIPDGMSVTRYIDSGEGGKFEVWISGTMTTKSGTLTIPVTADGKTFNKQFSYSLALKGATGKGISSVTNYYLATSAASGVTTSTTGWNTDPKTQTLTSTNKYLWNYEKITYTDSSTKDTAPCIIGNFANDGVGISSITEYYLASSSASGVTTSTSGWNTNVSTQTLDATKKYLWNYEKITYTGGKSETTTTPCIIGVFGVDGKTQYWHIKYSDDGGSTFTGSSGEEIGMWIGTYVDFNETDSTDPSKYTWKKFEEVEKLTVVTESHTTDIERTEENVSLIASKSYVETSALEEYKEEVDAEFDVRAEGIDMKFTTTTKQIEDVDGDLQSKFAKVYKHIAFNDNGITIGSGDSAIELVIDNATGIVFKKNGVQFGWWDGTNFHTGNIVIAVTERAQFGDYAFVPRSDGSLSFLKVGGTGVQEGTLSGGSDEQ